MHRGERGQTEAAADFLQARGVAMLLDEIVEEIEDLPLALGEWQHDARTIRKGKAKVNGVTFAFFRQSKSAGVSRISCRMLSAAAVSYDGEPSLDPDRE